MGERRSINESGRSGEGLLILKSSNFGFCVSNFIRRGIKMGHLAKKEEILRQLQKRLHQNPVGLPEHSSVYEILSILFNEREAQDRKSVV